MPASPLLPRSLRAALSAFCIALIAGGCNSPASEGDGASVPPPGLPPATGSGMKLGCTLPTFAHPFFQSMKDGLEDEAAKNGAEINVVDGKDKSQEQITAIQNFCVQKKNAIILCPTETETLGPGVEQANKAGIPVITVNRTVDGGAKVTYVGADDTEGGRMQGKALMELLPKGAKIVLLQGILGSSPQRNRQAGLEEALKGHPEYRIIARVPYDFQRAKGVEKMSTVLTQYGPGEVDAVVAQSDDGALAAADVCEQKKRTEIKIIGFNGESDAFDYIKQGKIHATILQSAEEQGRRAVQITLAHLKGEKVEPTVITPLYTITIKNIGEHKPAWESTKS